MEETTAPGALELRPYQWSVGQAVLKVLLYPSALGVVGGVLGFLSGNLTLALILLVGFPLVALPVAAVVGGVVRANRGTRVTADATQVVKHGVLSTTACPRAELQAIQYSLPLRGALECRFLRTDGRTAFRITLAPWTALQPDLKGFAAALGLPLRPGRWVRNFTL